MPRPHTPPGFFNNFNSLILPIESFWTWSVNGRKTEKIEDGEDTEK